MKVQWPDLKFPPINQPVLVDALTFEEMTQAANESPCVGVCKLEDGTCIGCHRTIQEIQEWSAMSTEERLKVMERINASSV